MEGLSIEPRELFVWALRTLIESGALVLLALFVEHKLLRGRAATLRAGLWCLVFARLLIPPLFATDGLGAQVLSALAAPGLALTSEWAPHAGKLWITVLLVWATTAAGFLLRLYLRARATRRMLLRGSRPAPAALARELRAIARALGLRATPRLRVHGGELPALVLGVRRPLIVLALHLEGPAREAALWHECMHLRRRDPLVQALFEVLHALWWFHPLLPLAKRRSATAREIACDAAVTRAWSGGAEPYRHALLQEAARRLAQPQRTSSPALAWLRGPATLRLRLEALEASPRPTPEWALRALIGLVALTSCTSAATRAPLPPALPAWWSEAGAARAELESRLVRRPGEGCAPGRLILLRALALEQGQATSPHL